MKKKPIITKLAHEIIKLYLSKDDIVIDATMGHGFDTLFLAKHAKEVFAFDIQEAALKSTAQKLDQTQINNVHLIHDTHENILSYVENFKGVHFNLGYLPHGDKTITTHHETTIQALKLLIPKLPYQGFISLVIYTGHERGYQESIALHEYFQTLDINTYHIVKIDLPYQDNQPPYMILIINEKEDARL